MTNVFIATVNDLEDPAGSLLADPQIWPGAQNPTVSNVINNGGNVTATISASCGGITGERKIGLNVIDSQFGVGTVPLRNGSASATNSALPSGQHRITAIYSGDPNYQQSSASITQTVNR